MDGSGHPQELRSVAAEAEAEAEAEKKQNKECDETATRRVEQQEGVEFGRGLGRRMLSWARLGSFGGVAGPARPLRALFLEC